jgi:hypothetical protein
VSRLRAICAIVGSVLPPLAVGAAAGLGAHAADLKQGTHPGTASARDVAQR